MANRIYYLRNMRAVVFNPSDGEFSLASRGCPVICLVSERNAETGSIKYGYSILHPEEESKNYSKAEGIKEAVKRLNESPLLTETKAATGHEINKAIIEHFASTVGKKNGQAWKLSRLWLKVSAAKTKKKAHEVKGISETSEARLADDGAPALG